MLSLEPTEELWGGVLFSIIHCETLYGKFDLTKKEVSPFLCILWVHIRGCIHGGQYTFGMTIGSQCSKAAGGAVPREMTEPAVN